VLMGGRTLETNVAADDLPAPAMGLHPDDLAVDRFEPHGPAQRFLHPADGSGGWRKPHWFRLLADQVAELVEIIGPGVEVSLPPARRQPLQDCCSFNEPLLDQLRCPDQIAAIAVAGSVRTAVHRHAPTSSCRQ